MSTLLEGGGSTESLFNQMGDKRGWRSQKSQKMGDVIYGRLLTNF